MDWTTYYPAFKKEESAETSSVGALIQDVEIADIGCGFGGLSVALAPMLPKSLILGEH